MAGLLIREKTYFKVGFERVKRIILFKHKLTCLIDTGFDLWLDDLIVFRSG